MAIGRKESVVINKALLLNYWNTNIRSFLVNLGVVTVTAGLEVLDAQATGGHYNWSVVIGASVAAAIKFAHSVATRKVIGL